MTRILILLLFTFVVSASAQQPQWGNLLPGPHVIGYKVAKHTDYARTYLNSPRVLQFYIWYPATAGSGKPCTYGDYMKDAVNDLPPGHAYHNIIKKEVENSFKSGALNPSFGTGFSETDYQKVMNTPVPLRKDAAPARGKFPLVLHTHVQGVLSQSVLLEYLASHGYVVMSVSMYNTSPAHYGRGEDGAAALLSQSEDISAMIDEASSLDFVDTDHVAVVGMVAQTGLVLQMKERRLNAIACLDCQWSEQTLKQMPFFNKEAVRIPILEATNSEFGNQKGSFLDSLIYADRHIWRFKDFPHRDFYPFPKIARPDESAKYENYEFIAQMTGKFLDAYLKGGNDARAVLISPSTRTSYSPELLLTRHETAVNGILTPSEFLSYVRFGDTARVKQAWANDHQRRLIPKDNFFSVVLFLSRDGEPHAFDAFQLYIKQYPNEARNRMLYTFLGANLLKSDPLKAVAVYKEYIRQFPDSPQAHDLLTEAYLQSRNVTDARITNARLLELLLTSDLNQEEKTELERRAKSRFK